MKSSIDRISNDRACLVCTASQQTALYLLRTNVVSISIIFWIASDDGKINENILDDTPSAKSSAFSFLFDKNDDKKSKM